MDMDPFRDYDLKIQPYGEYDFYFDGAFPSYTKDSYVSGVSLPEINLGGDVTSSRQGSVWNDLQDGIVSVWDAFASGLKKITGPSVSPNVKPPQQTKDELLLTQGTIVLIAAGAIFYIFTRGKA